MYRPLTALLPLYFVLTLAPASAQRIKTPLRTNDPTGYRGRQVVVGRGGGIAGGWTAWYLLDNGDLFTRQSRDSTFRKLGRQTPANTKRVFATLDNTCRIKTTRFNEPGNTYQFVELTERYGRRRAATHRVTWGAIGQPPPASYPRFYQSFMAMIPKP
jgi:hypothetical protein